MLSSAKSKDKHVSCSVSTWQFGHYEIQVWEITTFSQKCFLFFACFSHIEPITFNQQLSPSFLCLFVAELPPHHPPLLVSWLVGMPVGWLRFGIMSTPSADAIALHKEISHAGELPLTPNVCILATGNNFTSSPITDMATKDSGSVPKTVLQHLSKVSSDWVTCINWSVTSFDIHHLLRRLRVAC